MNKTIFIGRLARDPDLRYTGTGVPVCKFTIAVERPFTNQRGEREADFIDIVCWRKTAENVNNYLSKGRQVAVEGRLQIRSYDDNQGIRRKAAEIIADNVQFLGGRNGQGQDNQQGQSRDNYQGHNGGYQGQHDYQDQGQNNHQGQGQGNYQGQGQGYNGSDFGSEISFNEEDLPF